jgi:hypothetical protein
VIQALKVLAALGNLGGHHWLLFCMAEIYCWGFSFAMVELHGQFSIHIFPRP